MRKHAGFTIFEVVIALAVAGTMLGMVVPGALNAYSAAQSSHTYMALLTTFLQSSRHALVGGTEVVVCSTEDAKQCSKNPNWTAGWLAFADIDGDRLHDANETMLHKEKPLSGGARLQTTDGRVRVIFQPNGSNAGSNVTFTLCDRRGASSATALILANSGRLRQGKPSSSAASACAYRR